MTRSLSLPAVMAGAVVLSLSAQPARAQSHDRSWLDNCREQADEDRPRYCEERPVAMRVTKQLAVDGGENGGARVTGWDRDSVDVVAHIQAQASTMDAARELARRVTVSAADGTLRAEGPESHHDASWSVTFDVLVPHASDVRVTTENGPIGVHGVSGRMELSAVNGPLTIDGAGGDVHGRTKNGPLTVRLSGSRWEGLGLDAQTTNGPVEIAIPASYSAHLEAGTDNGPMSVGFPITVQGRIGRHISSDLGSGGATVRAVTTNGPLTISAEGSAR